MSLRALPLLLLGLGAVCAGESGPSGGAVLQRRYSEATLASDYSRAMDSVLRRNFVEWLLARREKKSPRNFVEWLLARGEKKSPDIEEPFKREAEPQKTPEGPKIRDLGTPGSQNLLDRVWKNRENGSFPALEGAEGLREFLGQEFLLWLMSGELCRATTT